MQESRPKNVRALIIGYGSIGQRHSSVLSKLLGQNNVSLVTSQVIESHTCFPSIEDVSNINNYDYFIISNETSKHLKTLTTLNNLVKGKSILVEKPLFSQIQNLSLNNLVYVGYNLRFHPVILKIKEIISTDKVLSCHVITGQYLPSWRPNSDYRKSYSAHKSLGGGVILDLSHELDFITFLTGKISRLSSAFDKISNLEIDSEDSMSLVGMTESNTLINLSVDYLLKIPQRKITITTTKFTLIGDLINNTLQIAYEYNEIENINFEPLERNYTYTKMHKALLENNKEFLCSYNEGLSLLDLVNTIKAENILES